MKQDTYWFDLATEQATHALCQRAKCGAVIVNDNKVIGQGYNAPPLDDPKNAQCQTKRTIPAGNSHDLTCCVHAEWRAIINALAHNSKLLKGATLYFSRADDHAKPLFSGEPYCTVCSRLALDVGISHFALWQETGITLYETQEYNRLSYEGTLKRLTKKTS